MNITPVKRCMMKRIVVRKPGTARLGGTSSVIHKG